jgi:hypothetical protein
MFAILYKAVGDEEDTCSRPEDMSYCVTNTIYWAILRDGFSRFHDPGTSEY